MTPGEMKFLLENRKKLCHPPDNILVADKLWLLALIHSSPATVASRPIHAPNNVFVAQKPLICLFFLLIPLRFKRGRPMAFIRWIFAHVLLLIAATEFGAICSPKI